MAKYSRTEKYEELRSRLQNNHEEEVLPQTKELAAFENRLKKINDADYEEDKVSADLHDPIHARRQQYLEEDVSSPNDDRVLPLFGNDPSKTSSFDNEYLDDYIKEIKEYNKSKGRTETTDTEMNILMALRHEPDVSPKKPYPDSVEPTQVMTPTMPIHMDVPEAPVLENTDPQPTIDLAHVYELKEKVEAPQEVVPPTPVLDKTEAVEIPSFTASEPILEDIPYEEESHQDTNTLTKEDIAADVQSMMNDQDQHDDEYSNEYDMHLAAERTARQQLLNETTQIRAQLDDYEDNLTDVSDKMNRTNRVLNGVLIVLIVALFVVLLVVIYWILSLRGVVR